MKTTYSHLTKLLQERKEQLKRGLTDYQLLDDGLQWVLAFTDAIGGSFKRGRSPNQIRRDFSQSRKGKGFHTMSAFGIWFATEDVLTHAYNGDLPIGQKEGCWEHIQPWSYTLQRIEKELETNGFDELAIASIVIDGTVKCFVSKAENEKLENAGLNDKLPEGWVSVFDRYDATDIRPLPLKEHDFDKTNLKSIILKAAKNTVATTVEAFIKQVTA